MQSKFKDLIYERTKVRIEEYKTIRTEVLQRLQTGTTLINISIVVVAGLLSLNGVLFSRMDSKQLTQEVVVNFLGLTCGFFIPCIFFICGRLIKHHDKTIDLLGKYSINLEKNINDDFNFILQSIDDSSGEELRYLLKRPSNTNTLGWITSIQQDKKYGYYKGTLRNLALECFNIALFFSLLTLASLMFLYGISFTGNHSLVKCVACITSFVLLLFRLFSYTLDKLEEKKRRRGIGDTPRYKM